MRYVVLGFLCLITVIAYVQRLALSGQTKRIESALGIGPEEMGIIMGAWYWGYALTQLPTGWIADRLGSKAALIVFALVWSAFTALAGLTAAFVSLAVVWGLMGCAQSGIFPCATKAVGATFSLQGQAFASGALSACMGLGAAIAQWLTAQLAESVSWQHIFGLYAIPGIVWVLAYWVAVPRIDAPAAPRSVDTRPVRWSKLIADRQMQLLWAQQFFRAAATVFFYTWFPRYLRETRGMSDHDAGQVAALPPLIGMFGGLLGGVASEWLLARTGSVRLARQGMACATMSICASATLLTLVIEDNSLFVAILCVVAFFAMACGVSGYSVAIAFGGKRVGVVFAHMNMGGNIGASLFPMTIGWLVGWTGNWNLAIIAVAGLFAASGICWAFLKAKGTLFDDEPPSEAIMKASETT